eukprot:TRINITY_DN4838_c0_g1_i1.p1 TRINITY_DN4838_c0_g1~~TRINITY_DN4838_c0_g1_i1.p1  ORF type:complete len:151 (+),score=28.46 TRINITY_DN4838_c0_g1_i1:1-453(+)
MEWAGDPSTQTSIDLSEEVPPSPNRKRWLQMNQKERKNTLRITEVQLYTNIRSKRLCYSHMPEVEKYLSFNGVRSGDDSGILVEKVKGETVITVSDELLNGDVIFEILKEVDEDGTQCTKCEMCQYQYSAVTWVKKMAFRQFKKIMERYQ